MTVRNEVRNGYPGQTRVVYTHRRVTYSGNRPYLMVAAAERERERERELFFRDKM